MRWRSETARGWRIAKQKAAHKIDVVVALGMAALACVEGRHHRPVPSLAGVDLSMAQVNPWHMSGSVDTAPITLSEW